MIDSALFVPGLTLSERFYREAVRPLLDASFPGLVHSAALLGPGSEVLGFDTARSTDHHWGPRFLLFLRTEDIGLAQSISHTLAERLPRRFLGIPTNFGPPDAIGVRLLQPSEAGPLNHRVEITTVPTWLTEVLGVDATRELTPRDWLVIAEQHLLSVTAGKVFHDGLGELNLVRTRLAWYPHDVWLLLLATQWTKISQEEAFVGRCGDVGDELGSALIANRLIRDLMKLCFLMERQYAPYAKWFGSAFARLPGAPHLLPIFASIQAAQDWKTREHHLSQAYALVVARHNRLNITPPIDTAVSPFHTRPYLVIHADRIAEHICQAITDVAVRKIAARAVGSIDQVVDLTDVLSPDVCRRLGGVLYD